MLIIREDGLILLSKTVELKWNSRIKKHYVDLGYIYTKMNDTFLVNVDDLTKGSSAEVNIKCDYCGRIYKKYWHRYLRENTDRVVHKDCCSECKKHKIVETTMVKYGVNSVFQLEEIQKRIRETNVELYGAENPFQSDIIKQRIKETNYRKYGVTIPLKSEVIKSKLRNTCLERYGVPYYTILCPPGKGELNLRWKGGVVYHRVERATYEYIDWRKQVFNRDHYACQCCGDKNEHGHHVKICAHHIKNWKDHPDDRYDVENGITFCESCHNKFHSKYGKKNNNKQQLDEFLSIHGKKVC